jgi:hypothetical protein
VNVAVEYADHFRDAEQCDKNLSAVSVRQDAVRAGSVEFVAFWTYFSAWPNTVTVRWSRNSTVKRLLSPAELRENRISNRCSDGVFVNET